MHKNCYREPIFAFQRIETVGTDFILNCYIMMFIFDVSICQKAKPELQGVIAQIHSNCHRRCSTMYSAIFLVLKLTVVPAIITQNFVLFNRDRVNTVKQKFK